MNIRRRSQSSLEHRPRSGMTLVELLTVISILGVLASLILPAIQSARQSARRAQCQNNLKQIGIALMSHATTSGELPGGGAPSIVEKGNAVAVQPRTFHGPPAKKERQSWGWAYQILPYIEQENRWANPDDAIVRCSHISLYLCPSRNTIATNFADAGAIHYVGNACSNCDLAEGNSGITWGSSGRGTDGVFVQTLAGKDLTILQKLRNLEQITDGLSNTVFVAEKRALASSQPGTETTGWVSGYPVRKGAITYGHDALFSGREGSLEADETDPNVQCTSRAGGPHGEGGNVLFGDGSVRFMTFGTDNDFWRALLSVDGREDLDFETGERLSR